MTVSEELCNFAVLNSELDLMTHVMPFKCGKPKSVHILYEKWTSPLCHCIKNMWELRYLYNGFGKWHQKQHTLHHVVIVYSVINKLLLYMKTSNLLRKFRTIHLYIHGSTRVRKWRKFLYEFQCKHRKETNYLITNNCTAQICEISSAEQMQLVCNVIILF